LAEAAPKGFGLSLAVAVVAVFIGVGAITFAYVGTSTPLNNLQNQVNTLQSQIPQLLSGKLATVNSTPAVVPFRIDWCNTDNAGQDRFCPPTIVVSQGDTVQIMFIANDTDAHTFTFIKGGYFFQLNNTVGAPGTTANSTVGTIGMHNFKTGGFFQASCQDGSFAQESASLSDVYCVSGSSLLPPGRQYNIAINPHPGSAPAEPKFINVDNAFHIVNQSATVQSVWSIGSFRATIPGIYEYFCYYHVSNGMFGYIVVLPNSYCIAHASACGLGTNSTSTA
jgi:plastocyanin